MGRRENEDGGKTGQGIERKEEVVEGRGGGEIKEKDDVGRWVAQGGGWLREDGWLRELEGWLSEIIGSGRWVTQGDG